MPDFWELYKNFEDERLKNEETISHYRYVIRSMEEFLSRDFFAVRQTDADLYAEQFRTGNPDKPFTTTGDVRLRILKSVGTFMEGHVSGYISPFTHIELNRTEKFNHGDLVHMEAVSRVLEEAERTGNSRVFMAVTLALRLCLAPAEIINLDSGYFFLKHERYYLEVPATEDYKERTLPVPDDVIRMIKKFRPGFLFSLKREPLFVNERKSGIVPIGEKSLWRSVNLVAKSLPDCEMVTLQNVRTLGIALLCQSANRPSDVAAFCGISEKWMYRYEGFKRDPIELVTLPNISVHLSDDEP